jgi:drug/metabolite transporter (DMT)-like permease
LTARPGRAWTNSDTAAHLSVVGAAVAFGSTFVPVQDAIRHAGPLPFRAVRFAFGAVLMAAGTRVLRTTPAAPRRGPQPRRARLAPGASPRGPQPRRARLAPGASPRGPQPRRAPGIDRATLVAGLRCGIPLWVGYILQTVGLRYTTTSISAFITYLLVVMVPLLEAVLARRRPGGRVMTGVVLATLGLFLLTGAHHGVGKGELLTLGCALAFAVNILEIDRAVGTVDPVALTAVQLAVVAVGSFVPGLFFGGYRMPAASYAAALYTGAVASALAFGLQVWGQRRVGPTRTSLLLMVEPVTAAIIGWATGAPLALSGLVGAALILVGIATAEIRPKETFLPP